MPIKMQKFIANQIKIQFVITYLYTYLYHFHHSQILKLASSTHTEWILNRDEKHNEIYQKPTKKLLQRQKVNHQINSRFTPTTDSKIGTFVLIPYFNTKKESLQNYNLFKKGHTKYLPNPLT